MAFKKLRSSAVLVFVDSNKEDRSKISQAARGGFDNDKAGKIIPKISFTNVDSSRYLFSVKYDDWKEESRTVRRIRKQIAESDISAASAAASEDSVDEEPAQMEQWTNSEGKVISAILMGVEDGKAIFKLKSGKTVKYPLSKLNEESRERAEEKDS